MSESNVLRVLQAILKESIEQGNPEQAAGIVLLQTMKLNQEPKNLITFYELLSRAKSDAVKLRNISSDNHKEEYTESVEAIEALQDMFVLTPPWTQPWKSFAGQLKSGRYTSILASLARDFHVQNPKIFLEQEFLKELDLNLSSLKNEVLGSELSPSFKKYLIEKIEDILKSISRYLIDGTEGLEKAAKSLLSDLTLAEYKLTEPDKQSPVYKKVKAWGLALVLWCSPSPYDLIGAVPDVQQFWMPKYEELATGQKQIEKILESHSSTEEIIKEAEDQNILCKKPKSKPKSLAGREIKALPPSEKKLKRA